MDYLLIFLNHVWTIWQEVAIWLLMGLIIAGSIQAFFPTGVLNRWLGGTGIGPVLKAAVIGTPLPLCSCSVLPTAIQLHRAGASTGATTSFLVATPENGADSIALSYVLLGPVMTVLRPVAAIVSAVVTGLLAEFVSGSPSASDSPLSDLSTSSSCCCDGDCGDAARRAQQLKRVTANEAVQPLSGERPSICSTISPVGYSWGSFWQRRWKRSYHPMPWPASDRVCLPCW